MKKLRWPLLIAIIALAAISILLYSQKPDVLQPITQPVVKPAEGGIYSKAVWHDGVSVTSDDIIFTIQMMMADDSPIPTDVREFWKQIEIVRLDEKTLQ